MPQGTHDGGSVSKAELRSMETKTDPDLGPDERGFTVNAGSRDDVCTVFSEVPVIIRWVLSIPSSSVITYRTVDDALVAIKAEIPKGHFKFQKTCRKTNANGRMVTHGVLK